MSMHNVDTSGARQSLVGVASAVRERARALSAELADKSVEAKDVEVGARAALQAIDDEVSTLSEEAGQLNAVLGTPSDSTSVEQTDPDPEPEPTPVVASEPDRDQDVVLVATPPTRQLFVRSAGNTAPWWWLVALVFAVFVGILALEIFDGLLGLIPERAHDDAIHGVRDAVMTLCVIIAGLASAGLAGMWVYNNPPHYARNNT